MKTNFTVPDSAVERFIKNHPEPRKLAYKPDLLVLCQMHDMLRFLCLEKGSNMSDLPALTTDGKQAGTSEGEVETDEPDETGGGGTSLE